MLSEGSTVVLHVSDSSRSKFQGSTGTKHTLKFFLEENNAGICPFCSLQNSWKMNLSKTTFATQSFQKIDWGKYCLSFHTGKTLWGKILHFGNLQPWPLGSEANKQHSQSANSLTFIASYAFSLIYHWYFWLSYQPRPFFFDTIREKNATLLDSSKNHFSLVSSMIFKEVLNWVYSVYRIRSLHEIREVSYLSSVFFREV